MQELPIHVVSRITDDTSVAYIPSDLLHDKTISPGAVVAYGILDNALRDGESVTTEELASYLGCSPGQAAAALDELRAAHWMDGDELLGRVNLDG